MVESKSHFWLVLFTSDAAAGDADIPIVPATWDGVIELTRALFPEVTGDLLSNLQTLKEKKCEEFEEEAGFRFLDAKRNRHGTGPPGSPPYFNYKHFCSLPKPRRAWQVRAFLYCELRLLSLYTGDGLTCNEGRRGQRIKEYLMPNVRFTDLAPSRCAVLPMQVEEANLLCE